MNLDDQCRELITSCVGEGWVINNIKGHVHNINKKEYDKFDFEIISSNIRYEVRKFDGYIAVYAEENLSTLVGLVIPKGVNHRKYTLKFIKHVNNHLYTKVYYYDQGWSVTNSIHRDKYVNSNTELLSKLLKKIKRAKELNKLGNSININMVFHGLPGTGKTKMVTDLAVGLCENIYIIDPTKIEGLNRITPGSILLIEELDKVLSPNGEFLNPESHNIGLLLQLLDGASRIQKSPIFITCNNIRQLMLNPILSRPGRNTDIIEFGYVNQHQCNTLCKSLYTDISDELANKLWLSIKNKNVTIAELSTYTNNCAISDISCESMISGVASGIKQIKSLTNSIKSSQYQ